MFFFIVVGCASLIVVISIYLIIFSPYRIRNFNSFVFLFEIFTIHLILLCILPFCQIYLLYFLIFVDLNSFNCIYHSIIIFYCVIESFFFLFTVEQARILNTRPLPKRALLPENYEEQFIDRISNVYEKCQDDFRICFAGWFKQINKPSSYDLIYEENILQFIAMSTYGAMYSNQLTDEQQEHVKRLLYQGFLKKYPQQHSNIKSGYNNQIQMNNPYRDLIQYTHYPMIKYVSLACIRSFIFIIFQSMGYEYQLVGNVPFYIRKYPEKTSSNPILFLHGLSLGVNSYILFIHRLTSLKRTIILLDIPSAGMRLHTEVLSMSTILSSIEKLLYSLNIEHIISISHSYGTFIQSCIVKQLTHFVYDQPVIFIDPVCFLTFDSRYMDNFIYRQPRTPNQLLLHTFCTEDLYSIYGIRRHLCWYECNLWAEDIKQSYIRTHVFFSENDDIIPVSFVDEYLRKSNIDTTIFPNFKHAQFLVTSKFQEQVLEKLFELETKPPVDNNEWVYF